MEFKVIDCCPVPAKLYPELLAIKQATGCVYASIYRGQDPAAQKYLTGAAPCFKHNQAWIYAHYPPGVANPPGYSTHECKNDGVAYSQWLRGASIPWWACGIDVDDAHVQAVCNAARARGWIVTITYPGSSVEYHHVNFRKQPAVLPTFRPIKRGQHGRRVKKLQTKLALIPKPGQPDIHKTYFAWGERDGDFGKHTEDAVQAFQRDHKLGADGVVGKHTATQLKVSYRHAKQKRKIYDLNHKLDEVHHKLTNIEQELKNVDPKSDRGRRLRNHRDQLINRADQIRASIRHLGGEVWRG